jgi:ribosomal protein S18 acetylase RimI-like enzyme
MTYNFDSDRWYEDQEWLLQMRRRDGLLALQMVGYLGSPDYLLIDDFEDMVYEMLHDPWFCRQASFAATDGERLVGALYTYHKGELAWIASLCVHPDARGQGLARRLMNHALAAYREAGFERAGLHVTLANRAAAGLYERMGFTLSERISLLYAKVLTPAAAERISGREAASPSDG